MDSVFSIALGFGLRALVDTYHDDYKVAATLVGLWEGVVLAHFLSKRPNSSDPYFALIFRLLCDLAVTESFIRFLIVVLWAGLGLVFADILSSLTGNSQSKREARRLERKTSARSSRSVVSTTSSQAPPTSDAHSSLQWPFFKSLAATRVHFYDLPGAPSGSGRARTGSELSVGSETIPRSILRSPPGSALSTSLPRPSAMRRVKSDIIPGTWSITETVTEAVGADGSFAGPSRSRRARMATVDESIDEEESELSLRDERSYLSSRDDGSELSSRSSEGSSQYTEPLPSIDQVLRPPTPPIPSSSKRGPPMPIPVVEDPLAYLDDELNTPDTPRSGPIGTRPPLNLTPLLVNRTELPPGPTTPTKLPDISDIPEIHLPPTPRVRNESYQKTPSLRDIPDMPTPESPTASRADPIGSRRPISGFSERPISGPPPYEGNFLGPPMPQASTSNLNGEPLKDSTIFKSDYLEKPPIPLSQNLPNLPQPPVQDDFPALPTPPAGPRPMPRPPRPDGVPVGTGDRTSVSTTASTLLRDAEELRTEAATRDREARQLDDQLRAATGARRYHDALRHKIAKEEADEEATKALRRAESKLFRAHNKLAGTQTVDVHALRPTEAVRRTEKAIAAAYERGDPALAVVVGPPEPSVGNGKNVKSAVTSALRSNRITFAFDDKDPNKLLVTLPYPVTAAA